MTQIRRLSTLLATLTAGIMLLAANPAAAGLADRTETATAGETVSIPVQEPRATTAVAAIQADVEEVAEAREKPAVKRATAAKPGVSRRAEHPAQKEYRPRPHAPAAPVRTAAVTVRHAAFGASCHRR